MGNTYFNAGCALQIYKPYVEERVLQYLNSHYGKVEPHRTCCRHEPGVEAGSCIINVCAGCDRRFRSLYAGVSTISLWEVIDQTGHFGFPDYHGMEVSVHDACPVREKPAVHNAVRSLLKKMNIRVVEAERHGTRSICCGDDFYPKLPVEEVHGHMKSRATSMPCGEVAVYCVSCVKAMHLGGKNPRHLIDLLFRETTSPGVYDTAAWHAQLQTYIDAH